MPILDDICDHSIFGPYIRAGLKQGRWEGQLGALEKGEQLGKQGMLRQILRKRFVSLPAWVNTALVNLTTDELDDLALRSLDASCLEDLFPSRK